MSLFLVISIFMIIIFDDDYYLLTKPQAVPWSAAKSCRVSCKDNRAEHDDDGNATE